MPQEAVFILSDNFTGESVQSKYQRLSEKLEGADMMIISTLDDIAWLTNLRGNDIEFNPVFFSYVVFHNKVGDSPFKLDLFIAKAKVGCPDVQAHLRNNNVTVYEYD